MHRNKKSIDQKRNQGVNFKNCFEMIESGIIRMQKSMGHRKTAPRGKFIAINPCIEKEHFQINNLSMHFNELKTKTKIHKN